LETLRMKLGLDPDY